MLDTSTTPVAPPIGTAALVPERLRPVVVSVAAGAAAITTWLAGEFAGTSTPSTIDVAVAGRLPHPGNWSDLVTSLGEPATVVLVAALVTALAWWRRAPRIAALAILGPGLTGIVTTAAKPLVGRRIADGSFSFPSGHTAGVTGICLLLGVVVTVALRRRVPAVAIAATTLGAAALVGAGLVAEHAHYATDVLAGFCVAVAGFAVSALVIDAAARSARAEGQKLSLLRTVRTWSRRRPRKASRPCRKR